MTLPDLRPGETWRQLAACRDLDIALFYPDNDLGPDRKSYTIYPPEARAACNACPVRAACLDHALDTKEKYGLWGGATPTERKKMRRDRLTAPTDVEPCGTLFDAVHEGV